MRQDVLKGNLFVYSILTLCVLTYFVPLDPLTPKVIATWPLPSSKGCRPPNVNVDGLQEGVWIGGGW